MLTPKGKQPEVENVQIAVSFEEFFVLRLTKCHRVTVDCFRTVCLTLMLVRFPRGIDGRQTIDCDFGLSISCRVANKIALAKGESVDLAPPENASSIIEFTAFSNLKSYAIPAIIFESFPNLEAAFLYYVGIQTVSREDFVFGKKLVKLDLQNNKLEMISRNVFSSLTELIRLYLGSNQISQIDDYAFADLPKLEIIRLWENRLTTVRRNTFSGANAVIALFLQGNQIDRIEDGAFQLPKLRILQLGRNKLTHLSNEIFGAESIVANLNLNDNHLTSLDAAIFKLNALESLFISSNPIQVNLTSILQMQSLQSLEMANIGYRWQIAKQITDHPAVRSSSQLKALDLSNNELSEERILNVLSIFNELKIISLMKNRFNRFDVKQLSELNNLEAILLHGNQLNCDWVDGVLALNSKVSFLMKQNRYWSVDRITIRPKGFQHLKRTDCS